MNIASIRGAITITDNTEDSIIDGTKILLKTIEEMNCISVKNVISIFFTATNDLDKVAPARAARDLGYTSASLMCFNEMNVENSIMKCIRVMVLCSIDLKQDEVQHVYLGGAKVLRPDLNINK